MPIASNNCIFTIVSRNYLHYAINLMKSVSEFMPAARRVVAICDSTEGIPREELDFEIIGIEELGIPHLDRLLYQYTILELNTAIKPYVFSYLFKAHSSDKIVYFDPDIQLFSAGDELLSILDSSNIVMTPHLTDFISDNCHPSEISIMQSGTYNLGFLALKKSESADKLLQWWQKKLSRQCVVDIENGLFTDQKWMDLVPGVFSDSIIVRSPGWNVAYWNLMHRTIGKNAEGGFEVNGEPLFFFHYSGYDKNSPYISKHQDRFKLTDLNDAVGELFDIYTRRVEQCGREKFSAFPYEFAKLPGGLILPDFVRQYLRKNLDWEQPLPDLRTAEGERYIVQLVNAPIDKDLPTISHLAWSVYCAREDLQKAFPDIRYLHRQAFVNWYLENAGPQVGIPEVFVDCMRGAQSEKISADDGADIDNEDTKQPVAPGLNRLLYRIAWAGRFLARPFLSESLRHKIRMRLLQRAYQDELVLPAPEVVADSPSGINVIGYLRSESGVGESSRSMLRALRAADVPNASVNFHVGNVSRQSEDLDFNAPEGLHYSVNLFHINADQASVAYDFLGDAFFSGRYRIGFWAWELPEFPDEWLDSFEHYDEIWVPSTFCQRAVAAKSPVPVVCIPHTIEIPDTFKPDRAKFGLQEDTVCFLSMADMLSIPERKNPLGAVEAFIEAFGDDRSVELLVKFSNPEARPDIAATLRELAARHANIHLLEGYLSRGDVNQLIESVNCFVSLHRSEGFGLVIAEAMARGKVVVATAWSGNMDFMTMANSLPVSYRVVELDKDYGPYRKGQQWAEPDIQDAVAKMRLVRKNPEQARLIGERARRDCQAMLSDRVVGLQVKQRLQAIESSKLRR